MKESRVFFAAMFLCLILFCSFGINPQGLILISSFLLIILASLAFLIINRFAISVDIGKNELLLKKCEPGVLPVTIKNNFIFPAMPVKISGIFQPQNKISENPARMGETYVPIAKNAVYAVSPPLSKQTVNINAVLSYCGEYELTVDTIEFYDLLKLFRVRLKPRRSVKVIVMPREITVPIPPNNGENETENNALPLNSDEADYSSVREYRDGDTLRRVHWKLSAKSETAGNGKLIVRQSEQTRDNSCVIFCDFIPLKADYNYCVPRIRDAVIETALSVARQTVLSGNPVTAVWYSNSITLRDYGDYLGFCGTLARMSDDKPAGDFSVLLTNSAEYFGANSSVYIIAPFVTDEIFDTLNSLGASSEHGVTLLFPCGVSQKTVDFIKTETKMSCIDCSDMF